MKMSQRIFLAPARDETYEAWWPLTWCLSVCVLFFLPSSCTTTSVRADSSIVEEIQFLWSQLCHIAQRYYVATYLVPGIQQAQHHTRYGTTYPFHDIKEKTQTKKTSRKGKKMKENMEETICGSPPTAGEVANTSKITSWNEEKKKKTPLLVSRVKKQRTEGKITKGKVFFAKIRYVGVCSSQ